MPYLRVTRIAVAAVIVALLAACSQRPVERQIALTECRVAKLASAAECGVVAVPEDRGQPEGRKLSIAVTVLPANTLNPKPDPLFMLAGGPGQSADAIAPLAAQLDGVRRDRDIVLIDQRGTGKSSPLVCSALAPRDPFDELAEADAADTAARRCREQILAAGSADVSQYTTEAYVADIDAVRAALGYSQINLWGGSYGARAAQHYLRRYPERVRAMVLDGVAPPSLRISLDAWSSRDAALSDVLIACREAPACHKAFPDLDATLLHIKQNLSPPKNVAVIDPRSGAMRDVSLSYDAVIGTLHGLIYAPEISSLIPEMLTRAEAGDYAPLAAAGVLLSDDVARTMNLALHYAVTCAEDTPRIAEGDTAKVSAGLRAPSLAQRNVAACDGWPRAALAADFATPISSDKPVLLLSGGLDPVTPPANAERVAKTLSNSRHIVAAGYGHIVSPHACAPRLIEKFIDDAGFANLPQSCIDYFAASKRPPMFDSVLEAR